MAYFSCCSQYTRFTRTWLQRGSLCGAFLFFFESFSGFLTKVERLFKASLATSKNVICIPHSGHFWTRSTLSPLQTLPLCRFRQTWYCFWWRYFLTYTINFAFSEASRKSHCGNGAVSESGSVGQCGAVWGSEGGKKIVRALKSSLVTIIRLKWVMDQNVKKSSDFFLMIHWDMFEFSKMEPSYFRAHPKGPQAVFLQSPVPRFANTAQYTLNLAT